MVLTLDAAGAEKARQDGLAQYLHSRGIRIKNKWEFKGTKTEQERAMLEGAINGRGGEILISDLLDLPLGPAYGSFHAADVGTDIQVRTSTWPIVGDRPRLGMRQKKDPRTHFYILLSGQIPTFRLVGWMHATEIIQFGSEEGIRRDNEPGIVPDWFVPAPLLHHISELPHFKATGKSWWDRRLDDLPDDFFDSLPHMTHEQRAEAKRLFKIKLADPDSRV